MNVVVRKPYLMLLSWLFLIFWLKRNCASQEQFKQKSTQMHFWKRKTSLNLWNICTFSNRKHKIFAFPVQKVSSCDIFCQTFMLFFWKKASQKAFKRMCFPLHSLQCSVHTPETKQLMSSVVLLRAGSAQWNLESSEHNDRGLKTKVGPARSEIKHTKQILSKDSNLWNQSVFSLDADLFWISLCWHLPKNVNNCGAAILDRAVPELSWACP